MKKTLYALIISIFFWNCSDKKKTEQTAFIIENKVKADFLNEILSDTMNLKLLPDQNIMISDFNFLADLPKSIFKKEESIRVNEIGYLSHHLKENDTAFIKQQIDNNKSFDLKDLSQFGYRILNTSELLNNGTSVNELSSIVLKNQTETDKLYNGYFILIDKPIFNKEMDRAYLSINGLHSGTQFLFVNENGTWKKENIGSWVE